MMGLKIHGVISLVIALACPSCAHPFPRSLPITVEVSSVGSDIETKNQIATRKLLDLTSAAISSEPNFRLARDGGNAQYKIFISQQVDLQSMGSLEIADYVAQISFAGTTVRTLRGQCKYAELGSCASQIVTALKGYAGDAGARARPR
jgi:hypothetical protein